MATAQAARAVAFPTSIVVFEIDAIRYAIETRVVVEILRAVAIRSLTGQPSFVAGVIDLRGTIVPAIDLRVRFGRLGRELSPDDQFIVAETQTVAETQDGSGGTRRVAFWVDRVTDLMEAPPPDAVQRAEGLIVGTKSLAGVLRTADGLILLHDLKAFVTEAELDAILEAAEIS